MSWIHSPWMWMLLIPFWPRRFFVFHYLQASCNLHDKTIICNLYIISFLFQETNLKFNSGRKDADVSKVGTLGVLVIPVNFLSLAISYLVIPITFLGGLMLIFQDSKNIDKYSCLHSCRKTLPRRTWSRLNLFRVFSWPLTISHHPHELTDIHACMYI